MVCVCLTDLLVLRDAHDAHGLQGLNEHVFVLLSRDGHVSVREEAILVVALQTQFIYTTHNILVSTHGT